MRYKFLTVGTVFNLAEVDSSLHAYSCSLSFGQRKRLDSLSRIESITDAYSKYFVCDIEHTGNNEHVKSANYYLFLLLEQDCQLLQGHPLVT